MVERHPVWPHLIVVWLEVFQPQAVSGRNADAGMDAEAGNRRTAGARWQGAVFGVNFVPHSPDAHASARSRRHAPRDRGAVELGEQRLVALKTIGLIRIRLRPQASFLHESCDTAMNALRNLGDLFIRRRGYTPEHRFALAGHHIEAIYCKNMEMRV